MRGAICLLVVLCLAAEPAFAQSVGRPDTLTSLPSSPEAKSPEAIKEIKERVAFWLKTCLEDWDAQTHMSKREWRAACERSVRDYPNAFR